MDVMPSNKPKVLLILDEDLLERIDDYRYENRIPAQQLHSFDRALSFDGFFSKV